MSDHKALKKHTASHDLFNRLHSIAADEAFVKRIAREVYDGRFEVIEMWDLVLRSRAYAYFKSTDGHTNNWNFNMRRSNLPLATYAESKGGFILVDSTRRGKRMPDALSKTVPIWCTVINLALALRSGNDDEDDNNDNDNGTNNEDDGWDTNLYLPPNIVSPSEKAQIMALIPAWAAALECSTLTLPSLSKPLRAFFIHPAITTPPQIPEDPPYTPIICVSSSRFIGGDDVPSSTKVGDRTVGFEYVPGAGDDDELWAKGLKPELYHFNRSHLLSADRDDLPSLVEELVAAGSQLNLNMDRLSISTLIGIPGPDSLLSVDLGLPVTPTPPWRARPEMVSVTFQEGKSPPWITSHSQGSRLIATLPEPRTNGRLFAQCLREIIVTIQEITTSGRPVTLKGEGHAASKIIPVALALDCSLNREQEEEEIDKSIIADSLHRLVTLWPEGNPPRAALKRVNEVLMSRGN